MSEPKAAGATVIKACPWPWCRPRWGQTPWVDRHNLYWYVRCPSCENSGPMREEITGAIDAWNNPPVKER
jgi:hypothetical protein